MLKISSRRPCFVSIFMVRRRRLTNEEAFLRHAVHNLSIDQHRRDRLDLHREVPIEDINTLSPLIAPESLPEDTVEAQQRLSHIRVLLDAVSPRTREIYFAHRGGLQLRGNFRPYGYFPHYDKKAYRARSGGHHGTWGNGRRWNHAARS